MKRKMKLNELKQLIRKAIKETLQENQPTTAPSKPGVKEPPVKAPGKPKPRRPLGNPSVKPAPKAENLNEEDMLKKIVARFKSKK
jgi:hypothetical protein